MVLFSIFVETLSSRINFLCTAGTHANRGDGDRPDEETDSAAHDEVGILPVPEGAGVCGGRPS